MTVHSQATWAENFELGAAGVVDLAAYGFTAGIYSPKLAAYVYGVQEGSGDTEIKSIQNAAAKVETPNLLVKAALKGGGQAADDAAKKILLVVELLAAGAVIYALWEVGALTWAHKEIKSALEAK